MAKQIVGVPKQIKAQERLVSRQPDSAAELAHNGRESFLLQSGASERWPTSRRPIWRSVVVWAVLVARATVRWQPRLLLVAEAHRFFSPIHRLFLAV
jgi:hypothetical protein